MFPAAGPSDVAGGGSVSDLLQLGTQALKLRNEGRAAERVEIVVSDDDRTVTLTITMGFDGDNCRKCGKRVRDFDPNGCELPDGERWHWSCMKGPVVALVNSTEYDRATTDYDHYATAGGEASFTVWAERYGSDYL